MPILAYLSNLGMGGGVAVVIEELIGRKRFRGKTHNYGQRYRALLERQELDEQEAAAAAKVVAEEIIEQSRQLARARLELQAAKAAQHRAAERERMSAMHLQYIATIEAEISDIELAIALLSDEEALIVIALSL